MPDLASLAGLGAAILSVPLVRWLHLSNRPPSRHLVPAGHFWSDAGSATPLVSKGRKPDPRWRLRAAVVSVLCLAIGNPQLPGDKSVPVTIWLDDSISMLTLDPDVPRMQQAMGKLVDAVRKSATTDFSLRSLGTPGRALKFARDTVSTDELEQWIRPTASRLRLPLAAQMSASSEHWLVTDGSDKALAGWLNSTPVSKIIQVGIEQENAGLVRLAARPSVADPDRIDVLVTALNAGRHQQHRELVITSDRKEVGQLSLDLAAGRAIKHRIQLEYKPTLQSVDARLVAADSLPDDDHLTLSLQLLSRVAVMVDASCSGPLKAAIASHPRLTRSGQPEIALLCSSSHLGHLPVIRFHQSPDSYRTEDQPTWRPDIGSLGKLNLQAGWLGISDAPEAAAGSLLTVGDKILVSRTEVDGKPRIDVYFDMANQVLIRQPEYPALVAGLIDHALGRQLLDESVAVSRPAASLHVGTQRLAPPARHSMDRWNHQGHSLAPYLILIACLLLLWDIAGKPPQPAERQK